MRRERKRWCQAVAVLGVFLIVLVGSVATGWAKNANAGILPPKAKSHGLSYEEWSARWWQWALSLPVDQNPFFDEYGCKNGANGQEGPVWFLTGVLNESGTAVRDCTVPAGKALFFPLINVECSTVEDPPFCGENEEELRACVRAFKIDGAFASIDGVPVGNLEGYSFESPLFDFDLPENNVLGLAAGPGQSVSNGYYLMLAPLPVGEHIINFGGSYPEFGFSLDITYNLTVVPRSKAK